MHDNVTLLSKPDFKDVIALDALHKKHMNVDKTIGRFGTRFWQHFVDEDMPNHSLLGYRNDDGELDGMMGMFRWDSFPYWTVTGFTLRPGRHSYSYKTNPALAAMWNSALEIMEGEGRCRFYLVQSTKWQLDKTFEQWHKYVGKDRYTVVTEQILPANKTTKFKGYQGLLGQNTWPEEVMIVSATLRGWGQWADKTYEEYNV